MLRPGMVLRRSAATRQSSAAHDPTDQRRASPDRQFGMVCWHIVKRTTVKLPEELDARLRHEAERRGTTVSELTREAIEAHLGGNRGRRRLLAAAAGHSGRSDVSERIEEILAAEAPGLR